MNTIEFDGGSITLVDSMGNDLTVVNAARVSFGKRKEVLEQEDEKLIKYLAKHQHMSPFRHVQFQFVIETSEIVMRQAYKHNVGANWISFNNRDCDCPWNEISGRYVVFDDNFHRPEKFRRQHKSNKQASTKDDFIADNEHARSIYDASVDTCYQAYKDLLALGVCKEQARMVLPLCFKTTVQWTASLEAAVNFIRLRDTDEAQLEIRHLAIAMKELVQDVCPFSVNALLTVV